MSVFSGNRNKLETTHNLFRSELCFQLNLNVYESKPLKSFPRLHARLFKREIFAQRVHVRDKKQ